MHGGITVVTVFMGWSPCISFVMPYATRFVRAGPSHHYPDADHAEERKVRHLRNVAERDRFRLPL